MFLLLSQRNQLFFTISSSVPRISSDCAWISGGIPAHKAKNIMSLRRRQFRSVVDFESLSAPEKYE